MNKTNEFSHIHEGDLKAWQSRILHGQNARCEQLELIEAAKGKESFLAYWNKSCPPVPSGRTVNAPLDGNGKPMRLGPQEIIRPPFEQERRIADCSIGIPPEQALQSGVWFQVALEFVRAGCIEPSDLCCPRNAVDNGAGADRISEILSGKAPIGDRRDPADDAVRDILRRMGGVLERGKQTVLQDCAWAGAYWRRRFACEAECQLSASTKGRKQDRLTLWRRLTENANAWRNAAEILIIRLTVLNEPNVRAALIWVAGKPKWTSP